MLALARSFESTGCLERSTGRLAHTQPGRRRRQVPEVSVPRPLVVAVKIEGLVALSLDETRSMQILNPISGRESAQRSSWRQSSSEHMLSGSAGDSVDRQSTSWELEQRVKSRRGRHRTPASRDATVPNHMQFEAPRGSGGVHMSSLTPVSPSLPTPGSGKGWSSLRKAHLERKLAAVGEREREHDRKLGKVNAFTSKLLGVFEYHMDADDDKATEGEGQVVYYNNKELVRCGVFIQCVGTTLSGVFIWMQLAGCYVVALLIGFSGDGTIWSVHVIDLDSLSSMTSSVCTLVAFMVGLCVSAALARWWQMRDACLGGLWGCARDPATSIFLFALHYFSLL
eukprot:COSAG02_NODE_3353_length_6884_cov_2.929108_2_plen_340_part_00